jgi:PTS system mannose-specific IIB component/fructoselysine and glucoselysine-specific PTS system IIB component
VPIELYRIDDRLIHGQVVVGWGQPLDLQFIVLVDEEVAASDWEQELYRMGVPPEMEVYFETVASAAERLAHYQAHPRPGLLLTGDIATMSRLTDLTGRIPSVNLGGIHHKPGRVQRLRYVFLSPAEESALRALAARGVQVTAQDVPAARPLPLEEVLAGEGNR